MSQQCCTSKERYAHQLPQQTHSVVIFCYMTEKWLHEFCLEAHDDLHQMQGSKTCYSSLFFNGTLDSIIYLSLPVIPRKEGKVFPLNLGSHQTQNKREDFRQKVSFPMNGTKDKSHNLLHKCWMFKTRISKNARILAERLKHRIIWTLLDVP